MKIDAQVVYEKEDKPGVDYGECFSKRVGVRLNDRVIWLGAYLVPGSQGEADKNYQEAEELAKYLVDLIAKDQL